MRVGGRDTTNPRRLLNQARSPLLVIAVCALAVAACSSGGSDSGTATTTVTPTDAAPTTVATPTPTSTTATTVPTPTTEQTPTTPAPDTDAVLVEAALSTWGEALSLAAAPAATSESLGVTVSVEAADALIASLHPDDRPVIGPPVITLGTSGTLDADGTVSIEECVVIERNYATPTTTMPGALNPNPALHLTGTATKQTNGTWQITEATQLNLTPHNPGCIPQTVVDEVLPYYYAFLELRTRMGNPPDPDNPEIVKTYVDPTPTIEALTRLRDSGAVLRFQAESHPQFVDYTGIGVHIQDCTIATGPNGVFEISGDPIDFFTDIGDHQKVLVGLRLVEGSWLVAGSALVPTSDCIPGEDPAAITLTGS